MIKTKFVWIIIYYWKEKKTQLQIIDTAHAKVTADTNHQWKSRKILKTCVSHGQNCETLGAADN